MSSLLSKLAVAAAVACVGASANAIELLDGFGGERGYGTQFLAPNDDGSTVANSLPFSINLFGATYSQFYVNNNGNVTFRSPLGAFTPNPFPVANQPMIAPYWADVDTRGSGITNKVWITSPNSNTAVITWDEVGYYGVHTDKTNSFQLVLRNQGQGDFDAEFRYRRLQWTTGDASGGAGGLGGVPAQAGWDAGDGVNFQILQGSRTADVLNLTNTSNVSDSTPGLWSFSFRSGLQPGSSPSNPLMPVTTDEGWNFLFNVALGQRIFVDPLVAVGYTFTMNNPGTNSFDSVELPNVGDGLFTLEIWDGGAFVPVPGQISHGAVYAFADGVTQFRVLGIETSANLDPNNTLAFVTGLTFNEAGPVDLTQSPVTVNVSTPVPEPETYAMLLAGIGVLGFMRRRQVSQGKAS